MNKAKDVALLSLKSNSAANGSLVPIELSADIPFEPKRIFYVYGVPAGDVRGQHAHFTTKQLLICLSGEIRVICDDGKHRNIYTLDSPDKALYIPELVWDECEYILQNSVLLVLSSTSYDLKDYITDYQQFLELKGI
tara:strand:- start:6224 stop:6634 length:411 start_codon:yes stop_codon:yes gene_type:complete